MHRLTATQMNLRPIIHLEADLALNHIKENEGGRLDVRPGTEAARSVRAELRRTHLTRCRFFQKKIARRPRTMPACNPNGFRPNLNSNLHHTHPLPPLPFGPTHPSYKRNTVDTGNSRST